MKVSVRTTLPCSIDAAWEALHTPAVFRRVSAPFTKFRTAPNEDLPERFLTVTSYPVTVLAMGLLPIGRQTIYLTDHVDGWSSRTVVDSGRGESGALAALRHWRHQMSLSAREDGRVDFSDQLTASAGVLTPLAWLGLRFFWWWRLRRLKSLARTWDAEITSTWNERYGQRSSMWSGKVNPVLADVAATLSPGSALDVGCGEGADAIHLAEAGWDTLGVEASSVALWRAHREASTRRNSEHPLKVHWKVADISQPWSWRKDEFDLVSLQFIHTNQATRQHIWSEAVSSVAPGGTLLIVGHDASDAERGIRRPPGEMCFDVNELLSAVPSNWTAVSAEVRDRTQVIDGEEVTVSDVVLVATR
jgi:SAM-dependent methyltransferase